MLDALKLEIEQCALPKRTQLLSFLSKACSTARTKLPEEHLANLATLAESTIENVDRATLREASATFAHLDFSPHSLIVRFAWDQIDVAAPVLQYSTVLTDDDLTAIIEKKGGSHGRFIALRETLTSAVTDCLINETDVVTLITAVKNSGAAFSETGFKELAVLGTSNANFGEALCIRADFPEELAEPIVSSLELDRYVKPVEGQENKRVRFKNAAKWANVLRKERSKYLPRTQLCLELIGKGEMSLDECVIELSRAMADNELCQVFAANTGLPEKQVLQIMNRVGGLQFVQFCKNLNLSIEAFEAASAMRAKRGRIPFRQIEHINRQYRSVIGLKNA